MGGISCYIADGRCDHRYFMPLRGQQARKFVVTCAAGFVNGGECLMDDEDMHGDDGPWTTDDKRSIVFCLFGYSFSIIITGSMGQPSFAERTTSSASARGRTLLVNTSANGIKSGLNVPCTGL
jgi:hypothetical protein